MPQSALTFLLGLQGRLKTERDPKLVAKLNTEVKKLSDLLSELINAARGVGGSSVLTQLVVANYDLVEKADDDEEPLLEDWNGQLELEALDADDRSEPGDDFEKAQAFGGSHHYTKRIVPLIPEHQTYVEPFAGAAALLYAKEPSCKEVIADNERVYKVITRESNPCLDCMTCPVVGPR